MADLIQIPKPTLGRPNDSRLTQAYLDARPELKGVSPFNPATDFDLIDTINDRLAQLHALVQYADVTLYGQMVAARDRAAQDHQQVVDNLAGIAQSKAEAEAQLATLRGAVIAKDMGDYVTLDAIAPTTVTDTTTTLLVGGRPYAIAITTLGGI